MRCSTPLQTIFPDGAYTYKNEALVKRMVEEQKDMRIPTELIPKCPICGKPMTMSLRADATFVQDEGWNIQYSFWQMTARNRSAEYICINEGEVIG